MPPPPAYRPSNPRSGQVHAATAPVRPAATPCLGPCSFSYDRTAGGGTRIAARSAGKSVGAVEVLRLQNGDVEIRNLNVSSEFRNRGIGSDLVRNAVMHAGRSGAARVVLEARPSRNSIPAPGLMQMYTKLGFSVTGISPRGHPTMRRMTGLRQRPGGR